MRICALYLAASVLLAGCSGSDSTGPTTDSPSGSEFDVVIGSGATPTYTWPGGLAHSVSVMRVSSPTTIVWGIASPMQGIAAPTTHGAVPGNALPTMSTEPRLTSGVRYRVSVTRADSKTGWKEFTP